MQVPDGSYYVYNRNCIDIVQIMSHILDSENKKAPKKKLTKLASTDSLFPFHLDCEKNAGLATSRKMVTKSMTSGAIMRSLPIVLCTRNNI